MIPDFLFGLLIELIFLINFWKLRKLATYWACVTNRMLTFFSLYSYLRFRLSESLLDINQLMLWFCRPTILKKRGYLYSILLVDLSLLVLVVNQEVSYLDSSFHIFVKDILFSILHGVFVLIFLFISVDEIFIPVLLACLNLLLYTLLGVFVLREILFSVSR